MQPIKCASCGSPDLEFFPGNYGRCRSCGTTFAENAQGAPQQGPMPYQPSYYTPPPPPPPPMGYAPQRRGGAGLAVGIVAAMVLLVGGGAAAFALVGKRSYISPPSAAPVAARPSGTSGPSDGYSVNAEAPLVAEPPVEPKTTAEFRDWRKAPITNGLIWVGRYVNTGETAIVRPSVVVSLFEAGGKRVAEQPGYGALEWLEPGEWTLVLVLILNPPTYERAEVKVSSPNKPSYDTKPVRLKVVEGGTRKGGFGGTEFVGTVRNTTMRAVVFGKVVVYAFDQEGMPVGVFDAYITEDELKAGGDSGFKVDISSLRVGEPARYEAIAYARSK